MKVTHETTLEEMWEDIRNHTNVPKTQKKVFFAGAAAIWAITGCIVDLNVEDTMIVMDRLNSELKRFLT